MTAPAGSIEALIQAQREAQEALTSELAAQCPGEHEPVQHRDGEPPWCKHCGRAATGVLIKAPTPSEFVKTCGMCRRDRTIGSPEHPMDAYDYSPVQAITGQPLGWYSADDGEVCPECMTKTIRGGL